MNPAMYLVAVLAFCALPSALGLTCYKCTSNETALELCTNKATYMNETCTGAEAECARTEVMTTASSSIKAYILGCVNDPRNCTTYETSLCANVTMGANALNHNVTKCETTCCNENHCNMLPTMAPPTNGSTTVAGTEASSTMASTTAAADVFRPQLIGLLFIVLSAVYFGVQ